MTRVINQQEVFLKRRWTNGQGLVGFLGSQKYLIDGTVLIHKDKVFFKGILEVNEL